MLDNRIHISLFAGTSDSGLSQIRIKYKNLSTKDTTSGPILIFPHSSKYILNLTKRKTSLQRTILNHLSSCHPQCVLYSEVPENASALTVCIYTVKPL